MEIAIILYLATTQTILFVTAMAFHGYSENTYQAIKNAYLCTSKLTKLGVIVKRIFFFPAFIIQYSLFYLLSKIFYLFIQKDWYR